MAHLGASAGLTCPELPSQSPVTALHGGRVCGALSLQQAVPRSDLLRGSRPQGGLLLVMMQKRTLPVSTFL